MKINILRFIKRSSNDNSMYNKVTFDMLFTLIIYKKQLYKNA